jgi:hypothetical protein
MNPNNYSETSEVIPIIFEVYHEFINDVDFINTALSILVDTLFSREKAEDIVKIVKTTVTVWINDETMIMILFKTISKPHESNFLVILKPLVPVLAVALCHEKYDSLICDAISSIGALFTTPNNLLCSFWDQILWILHSEYFLTALTIMESMKEFNSGFGDK